MKDKRYISLPIIGKENQEICTERYSRKSFSYIDHDIKERCENYFISFSMMAKD